MNRETMRERHGPVTGLSVKTRISAVIDVYTIGSSHDSQCFFKQLNCVITRFSPRSSGEITQLNYTFSPPKAAAKITQFLKTFKNTAHTVPHS